MTQFLNAAANAHILSLDSDTATPDVDRRSPPRRQCAHCPWRRGANPRDIPNGYDESLHRGLSSTIRSGLASIGRPVVMMACHETAIGAELPCVGWLVNQLTVGNNIGLRLEVAAGRVGANVEVVGPQHQTFEDTLPRPAANPGEED